MGKSEKDFTEPELGDERKINGSESEDDEISQESVKRRDLIELRTEREVDGTRGRVLKTGNSLERMG